MSTFPTSIGGANGRKILTLSARQRTVLHGLLHRDLRKCSVSALLSFQRLGWVVGPGSGYELTEQGRQVAELSEKASAAGDLELELG